MNYQDDDDPIKDYDESPIKLFDEMEEGISSDTDDWFEVLFPKILTRTAVLIVIIFFLIVGYFYINYPGKSITGTAYDVIFWNTADVGGKFFSVTWLITFLATVKYKRREKWSSVLFLTLVYVVTIGLCILTYFKYVVS